MSIQLAWDDEYDRVLLAIYSPNWTWDEIYAAEDAANNMVEESGYKVVVVVHDMSAMHNLPTLAVGHIRELIHRLHPATRCTVFVGMSPFVKTMWDISRGLFRADARTRKFEFAATLDEGRQIAAQFLADYQADTH